MGQRNMQYSSNMTDFETDQRGPEYLHPRPCIFYGSIPHYPQPTIHPVIPAPSNMLHHLPEHHDNALFFGMPQRNGFHQQHASTNVDRPPGPPAQYGPYMAPPSASRDFPVPINHGSYAGQPFQCPGDPWLGMQPLSNNSGDNDALAWNPPPALPYLQGNISGGRVDSGITGVQGYQVTNNNRSSVGFVPPFFQRHPNFHNLLPPLQGVRGPSISFPSQVTSSRSSSMNTFHDVVEAGPRYNGHVPPNGFRLYRPQRREDPYDMNTRHRNLPHLRFLPEDAVPMLEVPAYHEIGDFADQHREMRLDIDQMSYEELLALGEQIGRVTTGISEEDITIHLKTRSFLSSATVSDSDHASSAKEFDFCVVCQTDYKNQELVGTLDCGHEYHVACITKWLLMNNTCPVCKSTALNPKRKDLFSRKMA